MNNLRSIREAFDSKTREIESTRQDLPKDPYAWMRNIRSRNEVLRAEARR